MALVRLTQAAQLAGVSRSSMHRALKKGRVSYETDARGERWIDTSEIRRVYGQKGQRPVPRHSDTVRPATPVAEPEIVALLQRKCSNANAA